MYLGMEATINSLQKDFYPQKYFLEGEACKYFGLKLRTYFHKFLIEHKLEEGKYEPKRTIQSQSSRNSAVKGSSIRFNGGIGTTTGGLGSVS